MELMVLVLDAKVFSESITWRRNNALHFSPKGKMAFKTPFVPRELNLLTVEKIQENAGIRPSEKFSKSVSNNTP